MVLGLDLPAELKRSQHKLAELLLHTAAEGMGLSRQGMASALGISLETVALLLVSLQAKNAVRIERHRLFLHKRILARLAAEPVTVRAYGLLKTKQGTSERAIAIIRCQPGVIMTDWVEGAADVIFAVQSYDRDSLATLTIRAIASVELMTEEIQLLPAR